MRALQEHGNDKVDFIDAYRRMRSYVFASDDAEFYLRYYQETDRLALELAFNSGTAETFGIDLNYSFSLDENIEYLIEMAKEDGLI